MSEERDHEQAGAALEQSEPTESQVQAAIERANATAVQPQADAPSAGMASRPPLVQPFELPSAGETQSATEVFAAHPPRPRPFEGSENGATSAVIAESEVAAEPSPLTTTAGSDGPADAAAAEGTTFPPTEAHPAAEKPALPPQDGEIRISPDHPMAALYMQSPMPPEMKGNRGAGVLISLLATVVFALVYAGALALWAAPNFPPSTFVSEGLLPWIASWGFAAAVASFFLGMVLLVLIAGRAGWWVYVLGGFLVAVLVWGVTLLGTAFHGHLQGESVSWHPYLLVTEYGLFLPVIAAGLVAREATVWFGAWIGARGRKVKRKNAEALAEYDRAMADLQVSQP